MIRSAAYKVEFLIVFACVHNFGCVCLTWFVSVLFWRKIGLHSYLAPAACNRGGKPGELFAQQPPLWAATHPNFFFPSTSTIVQIQVHVHVWMQVRLQVHWLCQVQMQLHQKALLAALPCASAWPRLNLTSRLTHYNTPYVHDSSVGLRMFLGVIWRDGFSALQN